MINFNEHIEKELRNEYGGSEKKRTVIMDDGKKYLLKFPDPTREVGKRDKLSYINNALSEYIGCKIAKSMRLPVQEVILGTYDINGKTKIACACQDLRGEGEKLYEIEKLELGSVDDNNSITFEALEKIFGKIDGIDQDSIRKYYYDMFILDTLIGNKDRHNGNWGIIEDAYGNVRMAPIFDQKIAASGSFLQVGEKMRHHINLGLPTDHKPSHRKIIVISKKISKKSCISNKKIIFYNYKNMKERYQGKEDAHGCDQEDFLLTACTPE